LDSALIKVFTDGLTNTFQPLTFFTAPVRGFRGYAFWLYPWFNSRNGSGVDAGPAQASVKGLSEEKKKELKQNILKKYP